MRYLKYKSIKQNDMKDCGAACIATILRQYKSNIPISKIRELSGTNELGTNVFGIVQCLNTFDFESKAIKADMSIFDDSTLPYPAIAHIIKDEMLLHFVVIHKVEKNHLLISDPAEGLVKISKQQFEEMWTNAIIFTLPKENYISLSENNNSLLDIMKILLLDKKLIFHIVVAAFTVTLLGIIASFYFQTLIDSIIPEGALTTLNVISLGIIFLYIFQSAFESIKAYLLAVLGNRMSIRLMLGYYNHVLLLSMNFFATRKTGEVISRFTDASKVVNALASSVLTIILDVTMLLLISLIMFFQNAKLFALTLIVIPFYCVIILVFVKKYDELNHKEMEDNSLLNSFIIESVNGIETIKAIQAESEASKKVDKLFINYIHSMFKTFKLDNIQTALKQILQLAVNTLILWSGAKLVIEGTLSVGQLMTFNMMVSYFSTPLQNIINLQPQLQTAKVAADRLGEIFTIKSELDENDSEKIIHEDIFKGVIELKNVSFNYPMQRECLSEINMKINFGEKVAIVGKSGSGKSTLAKLLVSHYECIEGKIKYNDYNIKDISKKNLRKNVTLIPQITFFFSGSIYENLVFGLDREVTLEEVIHFCKIVCIHEHIESLPLGYSSFIEENAANFSGGQRQRLALARSLLRKSPIIIMDEATSSIDSYTEKKIIDNLMIIPSLTVIIIAHRLSILKECSHIYVMEQKKIVEQGTHLHLLQNQGTYYNLLGYSE